MGSERFLVERISIMSLFFVSVIFVFAFFLFKFVFNKEKKQIPKVIVKQEKQEVAETGISKKKIAVITAALWYYLSNNKQNNK